MSGGPPSTGTHAYAHLYLRSRLHKASLACEFP